MCYLLFKVRLQNMSPSMQLGPRFAFSKTVAGWIFRRTLCCLHTGLPREFKHFPTHAKYSRLTPTRSLARRATRAGAVQAGQHHIRARTCCRENPCCVCVQCVVCGVHRRTTIHKAKVIIPDQTGFGNALRLDSHSTVVLIGS